MNPLIKPQRIIGTGTLAVAGLLTATVLASGLSNTLESAVETGVQQVAFADDPTSASADSGDSEKGRPAKASERLKAAILAKMLDLAAPLDPADPKYKQKLYQQVLANRVITKLGGGSTSVSWSDVQGLLTDAFEIHRRSKQTVTGLHDRMSKVDKQIAALRQQVTDAKTKEDRERANAKLAQATNSRKELNKLLKGAEHHAKPFNRDAYIKTLERAIWGLEQQINSKLGKETKAKIKNRLEQARKDLGMAIEDRKGDDGDEGGTPAKRSDPKQPPKNPSTTGAKKTTTTPPVTKQPTTVRVPPSSYALEKAFRGAGQVRAGLGPLQGVAPPYSYKEIHDNRYLPTAYAFAQALQDAPTEKDRQSIEDSILRHVLPDAHKRKTFLEALRSTYRPQIVPDGKGNYVKAVNPIRTEWEEHIARAFPVNVPTPRELAIRKQEQIDREDARRGGPIKKPVTPRESAVRKQEQIDREQAQRGSIKKPVYSRKDSIRKQEQIDRADVLRGVSKTPETKQAKKVRVPSSREVSVRKQEQIDRADLQRGVSKTPATKKTTTSKKPTGKGGKNVPSAL
ncbi:hypothetical protein [Amycolatopsis sp.]|uniref:hypothetical protein n=1 Tax=Amycolatopsis sp. TaxID=37632 RepID=UPI002DFDE3E3|nr:hypothetical protein [Amycolatopsis sp.]